jgi:hypothetical protein
MQIQRNKRKTISELLGIVALTLLTIDTTNTLISTGTYSFLPLTDQQSGIYLGLPSVIMFFLSFGFAFRIRTRLTTSMLIAGGSLLAVSKIVEPAFGSNLYLVLLGLGIFRLIKNNK